jgi:deoxyribonuclease IV
MKRIGPHVSTSGGVQNAPLNAKALSATAFGMFTKNQRRWVAAPFEQNTITSFKNNCKESKYDPRYILAHDSYLINIGNPNSEVRKQSYDAFVDELERCSQLGLLYLNMHPGSHIGLSDETDCLNVIADSINNALSETTGVTVVLETTSGQGSNMGYRFEHLGHIINAIDDKSRVGICIDTCHIFAAGYDLRTEKTYNATMDEFEKKVGFKYLKGMHLNDSKGKFGSRLDRHNCIGQGELGLEPFKFIMNDPRMEEIPLVLETIDENLWESEIKLLYSFVK